MSASSCLTSLLLLLAINQAVSDTICQVAPTIQLTMDTCIILSNQSDVRSWGVKVGVQNANEICAVPSTVVNSTFITSSEICDEGQLDMHGLMMSREQCRSRRGGFIYKDRVPSASIDGLADINRGWVALDNTITEAANVTMLLGQHSVTSVAALFSDGNVSTNSHLGLAAGSTLLHDLKEKGSIGSKSWGLNSGSQSVQSPRAGSLVLGGFDEASLAGPFFEYDIKNPDKLETRYCPLQVLVTGLAITVKNGNTTTPVSRVLVGNANKWAACVEPYDNQFRMPGPILDEFRTFFQGITGFSGGPVPPSEYHGALLNIEPGMVYPTAAGQFNATLRFTLNYNLTVDIPYYEFQRPLRGLDADGKVVMDTKYTEYQIYGTPAEGDAPVLGKAFLSQLYLYVNYDTMKFYLASQNTEVSTPHPASFESYDCISPPTGRTPETYALIVIVSVLGAVIIAIAALWLYRRMRRRRRDTEPIAPCVMPMSTEPSSPTAPAVREPYDDQLRESYTPSPTEHQPTTVLNEMGEAVLRYPVS